MKGGGNTFHIDLVKAMLVLASLISVELGFYLILAYRTSLARWAGLLLLAEAIELHFR